MDDLSIPRPDWRRKYPLVAGANFAEPATDADAYWMGFIAADGCIWTQHGSFLRIKLAIRDIDHVLAFRTYIGARNPLRTVQNNGHPAVSVEVFSRPVVDALAQWGIGPNKSLTLPFPEQFPPALLPAFIRGYFDGNGTIMWRHRSAPNTHWDEVVIRFCSGSELFLQGLTSALHAAHIETARGYQDNNARVVPLSSRRPNVTRFAAYLYSGATIYLPRKHAKFAPLLTGDAL